MILDTSALVAVVFAEPGHERLLAKMADTGHVAMGAPSVVECGIVLSARLRDDARALLSRLLVEASIDVVPFTDAHFGAALEAWMKFGKGRHPAALNFGDCLAYATARVSGEPLLCVGDDFARTDIALA